MNRGDLVQWRDDPYFGVLVGRDSGDCRYVVVMFTMRGQIWRVSCLPEDMRVISG